VTLNFLSISLIAGRLVRCENCGHWFLGRRAEPAILEAAELAEQAALRSEDSPGAPIDEQERLRKLLEASKYQK
jgi:hypothetical protein